MGEVKFNIYVHMSAAEVKAEAIRVGLSEQAQKRIKLFFDGDATHSRDLDGEISNGNELAILTSIFDGSDMVKMPENNTKLGSSRYTHKYADCKVDDYLIDKDGDHYADHKHVQGFTYDENGGIDGFFNMEDDNVDGVIDYSPAMGKRFDKNSNKKAKKNITGNVKIGVSAENVRFAGDTDMNNLSGKLEGTLKVDNLTFKAEAGLGTKTHSAKIGADYNIALGKKIELEAGGSVRYDIKWNQTEWKGDFGSYKDVDPEFGVDLDLGEGKLNSDTFNDNFLENYCSVTKNDKGTTVHINDLQLSEIAGIKNRTYNFPQNLTSELHVGVKFNSKNANMPFGAMALERRSLNSSVKHYIGENNKATYRGHIEIENDDTLNLRNQFDDQGLEIQGVQSFNSGKTWNYAFYKEGNLPSQYKDSEMKIYEKPKNEIAVGLYTSASVNIIDNLELFGNASLSRNINNTRGKKEWNPTFEIGAKYKL